MFDLLSPKTQRLNSTVRADYEKISSELRTLIEIILAGAGVRELAKHIHQLWGTHLNCNYSTMSTPVPPLNSAPSPPNLLLHTDIHIHD